ncbi:hypothetical protein AX16_004235 [Volvariella volvacea WC 439]|nr:hypothetical protein AX16_004235 [Volvariella volvacea WC 439]
MSQHLILIYNPVCGDGTAKSFVHEHVLPLLAHHGKQPDRVIETQNAQHAGSTLLDYLLPFTTPVEASGVAVPDSPREFTVILASGDGTLHDIINHLLQHARSNLPRIHFALIPCGTANALYSAHLPPRPETDITRSDYKLQSLAAYLSSRPPTPLNLAITVISPPPIPGKSLKPAETALSTVVISTSLHASILHDSEALRKEMPGIERFKVAAQQNSTRWYLSSLKLYPSSDQETVQVYDPQLGVFGPHPDAVEQDPLDLEGPFAYFLSTINVDRLEPAFRITPFSTSIPPKEALFDVVVIRPLRDPSISWNSEEARTSFVSKLWAVLGGAYQDGNHVKLRYNGKGEVVVGGDGELVVEYFRCAGWEWIPFDMDERAHFVCVDGAIFTIPEGGRVTCTAATPQKDGGFALYT